MSLGHRTREELVKDGEDDKKKDSWTLPVCVFAKTFDVRGGEVES